MNIADIKKATETTAPMGSLRRDSLALLVAMILVGVIAAVTLSIVSYYNLTKNAERDSQVLVKSAGALVSGFFEEPFSMIRCISVSSDKMQEEGDPNIDLMLESNLRDSPSFDSLMVLDRSGVITHIAPYDAFYMGRNMSGFRFFFTSSPGSVTDKTDPARVPRIDVGEDRLTVGQIVTAIVDAASSSSRPPARSGASLSTRQQQYLKEVRLHNQDRMLYP